MVNICSNVNSNYRNLKQEAESVTESCEIMDTADSHTEPSADKENISPIQVPVPIPVPENDPLYVGYVKLKFQN